MTTMVSGSIDAASGRREQVSPDRDRATPVRVLIGIDGSPAADIADRARREQFLAGRLSVVVAEAIEAPPMISAVPGTPLAFVDVADIAEELRAAAGRTVEAARDRWRRADSWRRLG